MSGVRKSLRPTFDKWRPSTGPNPANQPVDRAGFAGLEPRAAARRLVEVFRERHEGIAASTGAKRTQQLTAVLTEFARVGKDLSSLTPSDVTAFRAYLKGLVDGGDLSQNTAAVWVDVWNVTVRVVFREAGKAGEGLLMKTMPKVAKAIDHLTQAELDAMVQTIPRTRFESDHNRSAFRAWIEIQWCAGPRVGSLMKGAAEIRDVDWARQVIRLRKVKNRRHHEIVLTPRAMVALSSHVELLRQSAAWHGDGTPLFCDAKGNPLSDDFANEGLKRVAIAAGIRKSVTTHAIRKAAGTLIAKHNPRLAQEQLGITERVFNRHYNQPTLQDRIDRRDILPGGEWTPTSPEEIAGAALLDLLAGRSSKDEFDAHVAKARALAGLDNPRRYPPPGYA